ncbi:diacylglycerol/lipid kinase family protein [Halanaerobium congolense]|jgi:YegS/Rv2252/BmrU family lipid kinase|uniref:Lipid kinase, YegS/Rv2252/BmrU family n=1 Tax=Halanaerobium congolense TaxID=54121 RepID=A0A1M7M7V4_9FIRM|nr:YegS/Rv2252/BmrU family lipid kinase [Halanaerobium congolense]KXS49100.1 MAG: Transcription regulator [Halanaerobium sp. T82-1]OEG62454.1 MAG: diacylglycerol kinase [Halanaerobium sp. MDAL1]PUU90975.1 MAG: diacylglycerol kinase catalytic subunit [Halanaerobium sp.]PTX17568.1 YegS/Rv2252/BmrU family lipid kinase [Halanaerobium congolense]TDP12229.1 YegS/Rv2252/BmrU family lipid kinase [Halanaerobium congolense]
MLNKKVKLIYNPAAGNQSFNAALDMFLRYFQAAGYKADIFRSMEPGDFGEGLKNIDDNFEAVIVAGGDGSASEMLNLLQKKEIDLPLGIIPAGTANDFASFLGMTQDIERSIKRILDWKIREIDVGKVNDRYFLNVCVGGIISQIAHGTETDMKNRLGKAAYYLQGLKELPNIKSMNLRIESSEKIIEGDFLGFFVFNSKDAGGFKNIARLASIDDGLFDLLAVKTGNILKLSSAAADLFNGKNIKNDNLIYLQDNYLKITMLNADKVVHCDIDGEKGPAFPLEIKLIPSAQKVFTA